jgi:hypothetical protein
MTDVSRAREHPSPREGHRRIVRQQRSFRDLLANHVQHRGRELHADGDDLAEATDTAEREAQAGVVAVE